jgi:serine/threonine protein kinase/formylglycine-generating enzyme required for sulfatase activity/tetratricopeptide (TPR) repeat protein
MRCPSVETLSLYRTGQLDEASLEGIAQHVEFCQDCRGALSTLDVGRSTIVSSDSPTRSISPAGGTTIPDDATTAFGDDQAPPATDRANPSDSDATEPNPAEGDRTTNWGGSTKPLPEAQGAVERAVGRYRIVKRLGGGSFGTVYLASDPELDRLVAIKLAHKSRIRKPEDIQLYLDEARALALLDHPHVLPVFDVGRSGDGSCFVVTKYVEGSDLSELMTAKPLSQAESARLLVRIASGLDHAHRQGVVHRDIKPANILIADDGHPYLADFGLAVRESESLRTEGIAGTPEYMSPEQARGEGHRIDARSDIYSLGVVFYRMLTGQRPYQAKSLSDLLEQVIRQPIPPPIEINAGLDPELDRVCRRMLERRAADRYQTAGEVVEELEAWLRLGQGPLGLREPARPMPKGLRSFEAADADSFLELLPGPRDRDGLPSTLGSWKRRIEATEGDPFAVGLLLGPSGSGKSSLIAAGLLPRLGRHVVPIVVDPTKGPIEPQILSGVRSSFPGLSDQLDLAETLASVRRGGVGQGPRKVLLVLDQFEQRLSADFDAGGGLVDALRQADGIRLQALLIVRDDFALAASRFFDKLEIPIVQGRNFDAIDRFSPEHARNVLVAFGQGCRRLPRPPVERSPAQEAFLDEAIRGLVEGGAVAPVRLAVFVEMVRDREWTPGAFRASGGVEGLGVAFLDSLFHLPSSNPRLRSLAEPARMLLKALLPPPGATIRGASRSAEELLEAVGNSIDVKVFDELTNLLDAEARLITSTVDPLDGAARRYQLAHDYLVRPLRVWLTLKQRETARGRAELLLAERASGWTLDPTPRQLPTARELAAILLRTRPSLRSPTERVMLRAALKRQGARGLVVSTIVLMVLGLGLAGAWRAAELRQEAHARGLVARLIDSDPARVPDVLGEIQPAKSRVVPLLDRAFVESPEASRARRRAALGLVADRPELAGYLAESATRPDIELGETLLIADLLVPHAGTVAKGLWTTVNDERAVAVRRFRSALLLAKVDPSSVEWSRHSAELSARLLSEIAASPADFERLANAFKLVRDSLTASLLEAYRSGSVEVRPIAFQLLTRYSGDDPSTMTDLLVNAEPRRIDELLPLFRKLGPSAMTRLEGRLAEVPHPRKAEPPKGLPAADARAVAALESAGGRVSNGFGFCQSLPLDDLVGVNKALETAGYRPTRIRPYADGRGTLVAAIWTRDARPSRLAVGITPEEFARADASHGKDGFEGVDVAPYPSGDQDRICAVWARAEPGSPERRSSYFADEESYRRGSASFRAEAFDPVATQILDHGPGGRRSRGGVWVKFNPSRPERTFEFNGSSGDYSGDVYLGAVEVDVSLGTTDRPWTLARRMEAKLAEVEALLAIPPQQPNDRFLRGYAHFQLGNDDKALADWNALIREVPTHAWMWKRPRMVLYARRGNFEAARADLRDFLDKSRDESQIIYLKEYLAACEGDLAGAVDRLLKGAEGHPGDSTFLYSVSNVLSRIAGLADRRHLAEFPRYSELALDVLERAVKAGLKVTPEIRDDPDFEPIHQQSRFIALMGKARLEVRYAAIWRGTVDVESVESHGLSLAEHLARCRELETQGYYPAAIGAFRPSPDEPALTASVWQRPRFAEADLDRLANRQANAAVALIRLGLGGSAWPLLADRPDPRLASAILHRLSPAGVDPATVIERLSEEPDPGIRRSLVLALGLLPESSLGKDLRSRLAAGFAILFRDDPDSGVHSAVEWLLRRWDAESLRKLEAEIAGKPPRPGFQWIANRSGDTLSVHEPLTFVMGGRPQEFSRVDEQRHRREIPRRFAVATKEVTNRQSARFLAESPGFQTQYNPVRELSPTLDCAASGVSWPVAIAYCRWLTRIEGLPDDQQCYDEVDPASDQPPALRQGYLVRLGYRLPTEPEWECADRSGSVTNRSYGESDELLREYAWYLDNTRGPGLPRGRVYPVGLLLPNRWGLFDTLGNVAEWTSSVAQRYPTVLSRKSVLDSENLLDADIRRDQIFRGGAFTTEADLVRSPARYGAGPWFTSAEIGFRVARTLPD